MFRASSSPDPSNGGDNRLGRRLGSLIREGSSVQDEWTRKGATLSDKTARKEFGLTQDESWQRSTPVSCSTELVLFTATPG